MKREILFKGRKTKNGKWIEGHLVFDAIGEPRITTSDGVGLTFNKVQPETVCQFTGFLDKKGKKIFEGDFCKGAANTCLVVFGNGAFRWELETGAVIGKDDEFKYIKVIGNIHD